MKPRPYQADALTQIRDHYARGNKRVLLHLSTGGGKTFIFCRVLKGVYDKGKKAIMVVAGVHLVEQAAQRLAREHVKFGVMQGNHWLKNPNAPIQLCSIDTLYQRKIAPEADLIIFDEAHLATSNRFKWLIDQYDDNTYFLPVTATPHVPKGLKHLADHVVYPITIGELIEQKYLVQPKYFKPTTLDLSSIRIDKKSGEYQTKDLEEIISERNLYGDVVSNYVQNGECRPFVAFAVSVAHSKILRDMFLNAGIKVQHVDAKVSLKKRQELIEKLEHKELQGICSVGTMVTGVDMPCVSCLIVARPTKSYNLWIQLCGRGTRPYPGKEDFYIFDHVGNTIEHGLIEDEKPCNLLGTEAEKRKREAETVINCEKCFAGFAPGDNYYKQSDQFIDEKEFKRHWNDWDKERRAFLLEKDPLADFPKSLIGSRAFISKRFYICPECQFDNSPIMAGEKNSLENQADILKQLTEEERFALKIRLRIKELKSIRRQKKYKQGWVYYQLVNEYGEDIAEQYHPKREVPDWIKSGP